MKEKTSLNYNITKYCKHNTLSIITATVSHYICNFYSLSFYSSFFCFNRHIWNEFWFRFFIVFTYWSEKRRMNCLIDGDNERKTNVEYKYNDRKYRETDQFNVLLLLLLLSLFFSSFDDLIIWFYQKRTIYVLVWLSFSIN